MPRTRSDSDPAERADEFMRLFLRAIKNEEIARGLREALGVQEQLAALHRELTTLRTVVRERETKIDTLQKEVAVLKEQHDDLEQYSRRNSVRLSGLPESPDENVVALVMKVVNEDMAVTPPLAIEEIDRIHRVGKSDGGRHRPLLIKFATYRSRRRVISQRRFLNPQKRTERRQMLGEMLPAGAAAAAGVAGAAEAWQQPPAERANAGRTHNIYMNDDLTRARAQLLYRCRTSKKENKIADCWSTDGTILVKALDHRITSVKSEADLAAVCMRPVN